MTTQRSARPESAALERVASLDGLRGFACATVFLANFHHAMGLTVAGHVGPWDVARFAESGLGVVIFVVLSGALLSIPCWRALGGGRAVRWA